MNPILRIVDLKKSFGGLMAIKDLSFDVSPGKIMSIIGPNGAGKTTLFNLIMKVYPMTAGEIFFKDIGLRKLRAYQVASLGIGRTYQNVRLFGELSAIENIMVGKQRKNRAGFFGCAFHSWRIKKEEEETYWQSQNALRSVNLDSKELIAADSLSFGEQKLLEIARASIANPELLLLDEPAAGLNSHEVGEMKKMIFKIRESGVTILLIEHDMNLVMDVSDEIVVLNYGEKIAEGKPDEIRNNQKVIDSYLGKEIDFA